MESKKQKTKTAKKISWYIQRTYWWLSEEWARGDEIGDRVLEKEPNGNSSVAKYNKWREKFSRGTQ